MKPSKNSRIMSDQKLIAGIVKHLGKTGVIVLKGEKHKVADILATLQARIEAGNPVDPAWAAWMGAVENERTILEETKGLVADVKKYLAIVHGSSPEVLADFGFTPKKRALKVEEKAEAVSKAKATREARHTMGSRQKEKVKGVATSAPAPTPAAPTNGSSAANGV